MIPFHGGRKVLHRHIYKDILCNIIGNSEKIGDSLNVHYREKTKLIIEHPYNIMT